MDEVYEFTTEVNDEDQESGLYTPGEVLCYGWYDPDVEDGVDDMVTGAVGSSEPLRGIWLEAPPPPPPPLPAPTRSPPLPQLPAAAPTTPPEAYMRPKAAPTASSASSASASVPPLGLGLGTASDCCKESPPSLGAAAKSRWGPSARRFQHQCGRGKRRGSIELVCKPRKC